MLTDLSTTFFKKEKEMKFSDFLSPLKSDFSGEERLQSLHFMLKRTGKAIKDISGKDLSKKTTETKNPTTKNLLQTKLLR